MDLKDKLALIRVAVLDDHPAVRAGLDAIVEREQDLVAVGSAANEEELWPLLRRTQPAVIVLDVHHPGRDGLLLCLQIKNALQPPAVVLYSAATPATLTVAAAVAGADAVVGKSRSTLELLEAIRTVAHAARPVPAISTRMRAEVAAMLDPFDHAILALRLAAEPPAEIAKTLSLSVAEVADRIASIVGTLTHAGDAVATAA